MFTGGRTDEQVGRFYRAGRVSRVFAHPYPRLKKKKEEEEEEEEVRSCV
jgi:hypothetical protein